MAILLPPRCMANPLSPVFTNNHDIFLYEAKRAEPAEIDATLWIWCQFYKCKLLPKTYGETAKDWRKHVDHGDIEVWIRGNREIIGVKQRPKINFTVHRFPYASFMICRADRFNEANPKPLAFIIYNATLDCAGLVWSKDKANWWTEMIPDIRYGPDHREETYFCDTAAVKFVPRGAPLNF